MAASTFVRVAGFVLLATGIAVAIGADRTPGRGGGESVVQGESAVPGMSIEDAHKALTDSLMSEAGIAGIGISECDGSPCLKVYVVARTDEVMSRIPKTFEGYQVTVMESGEIEARE